MISPNTHTYPVLRRETWTRSLSAWILCGMAVLPMMLGLCLAISER